MTVEFKEIKFLDLDSHNADQYSLKICEFGDSFVIINNIKRLTNNQFIVNHKLIFNGNDMLYTSEAAENPHITSINKGIQIKNGINRIFMDRAYFANNMWFVHKSSKNSFIDVSEVDIQNNELVAKPDQIIIKTPYKFFGMLDIVLNFVSLFSFSCFGMFFGSYYF